LFKNPDTVCHQMKTIPNVAIDQTFRQSYFRFVLA
jgi:hypothetical protein